MEISEFPLIEESEDKKFRFANQKVILTYKTHINKDDIIAFIKNLVEKFTKSIKFIRCAHETGKKTGIEYDHTHVVIDFGSAVNTKNCRFFDFKEIHPNIRKIIAPKHWRRAMNYLAKEDPDNQDLKNEEDIKPKGPSIKEIWDSNSLTEALLKSNSVQYANNIIATYNAKPTIHKFIEGTLRPWQKYIISHFDKPVDRKVVWIYDSIGNAGKSWFTKFCASNLAHKCMVIVAPGKQKDISTVIRNEISSGWKGNVVIIDIPRAADFSDIYTSIEDCKNGMVTAIKYQGKTIIFDCCHVFVMSNFFPNTNMLSMDRWKIINLQNFIFPETFLEVSVPETLQTPLIESEAPHSHLIQSDEVIKEISSVETSSISLITH